MNTRRNFLEGIGLASTGALSAGMWAAPGATRAASGPGSQTEPVELGRVLADAILQVENTIRSNPMARPEDLADGYRYLAGMVHFYIERFLKGGDVLRPCFVRDMDSFRSWGLPTPNHHYYSAQIDGQREYRITGERGDTADLCFEVLTGLAGDDGVIGRRIDALQAKDLDYGPDGRFEIIVGGEPRPRNWLRGGGEAKVVFVRQTVDDWIAELPTPLLIEPTSAPQPFRRPDLEKTRDLFERIASGLVAQTGFLNDFALHWSASLPLNTLDEPSVGPADAGYFPGQFNTKCRWEIAVDEALLIAVREPNCAYQSLDLAHPLWFDSIYPREVTSSLTQAQSRVSADGITRYVISASDPGVPNWLDTAGLLRGFLFIRWQGVEGQPPARPSVTRTKLADVARLVPPGDSPTESRMASSTRRRLARDRQYF